MGAELGMLYDVQGVVTVEGMKGSTWRAQEELQRGNLELGFGG